MKKIARNNLSDAIKQVGIPDEKINRIIGTLEISLARQSAKSKKNTIVLEGNNLSELKESLRIGADITTPVSGEILVKITNLVEKEGGKKMKFFDNGTFEMHKGNLKFKKI